MIREFMICLPQSVLRDGPDRDYQMKYVHGIRVDDCGLVGDFLISQIDEGDGYLESTSPDGTVCSRMPADPDQAYATLLSHIGIHGRGIA